MENKRTYTIEINGIDQSIKQVEALNAKLNELDAKIKKLEESKVNVSANASTSTSSRGNASALSEEAAIQKEINKLKSEGATLDAKIAAAQDEVYKKVDATKQLYKETIADQKALAAQERLVADAYSNTMQGMKNKLADLKSVINTTDLGDTDQIKKMTQEAGELTKKLKEMEEAYGQFGRNVDNYKSAAEGFSKYKIEVGGVEREFNSAREAARTLTNELLNLPKGAAGAKELRAALQQVKSEIQDIGKSSSTMDNLLDTMQSFTAIGQITQGFSALFGFDNDEIERSIQKLVALQNAMQGIEAINKQLNTQEGIGGWLAKGNSMIDSFVEKLVGAKKAQEELNAADKAGKVASEGLAAAETAQAAATSTATVATKALSLALKTIGIGLIISAVAYLVENWEELYDWLTDTIPALKNLGNWFDKIKAIVIGVGSAIVNYMVQPLATVVKTIQAIIRGNFSDIPKIISDGFKQTFNVVGNFQKGYNKEIERQQRVHNNKLLKEQKEANDEWLADQEAKYGKSYANTKKYLNQQMELVKKQLANTKKGSKEYDVLIKEQKDLQRKIWENERTEREKYQKKAEKEDKEYQKKNLEAEKELIRLRIENMKEGLNKTMKQLEEERRQKIAKIRADGVMVKELELETNKYYDHKIAEAKKKHAEEVVKTYKDMWDSILAMNRSNAQKNAELAQNADDLLSKKLENGKNQLFNQNIASYGIQGKNQLSPSTKQTLGIVSTNKNDETVADYKKLIDRMREYTTANNAYKTAIIKTNDALEAAEKNLIKVEEETNKKLEQLEYDKVFMFEGEYEKKKYEIEKELDQETIKYNSLKEKSEAQIALVEDTLNAKKKLYDDYYVELQKKYDTQEKQEEANATFNALIEENYTKSIDTTFQQRLTAVEAYWAARKSNEKTFAEELFEQEKVLEDANYSDKLRDAEKNAQKLQDQLDDAHDKELVSEKAYCAMNERIWKEYGDQIKLLEKEHTQKLEKLENEKNDKIKQENAEYYQDALQEFRDFQTAINNLEQKQPIKNIFGIVNLKETNKNNRELLASFEELVRQVNMKRDQLIKDFQNGLIDNNIYESSLREMDSFVANIGERMDKVKYQLSFGGKWEQLAEGINYWMQAVGQAVNSVLSSLSEITDNHYQAEIDKQQEYIDEYEELLDKQKDITQKHADEVNSIEDELSTARGDRRQQLIDQLNAEMAAQRASLAQEKKIEREKEKAEQKKKKLEHDQAVAKKNMQEAQAYINMAMAISMAAVNSWPIPAIPMMALAAAAGAAQIAAIKSQNIPSYGSGGVIQGKSHREGGVKVLGGQAEVEGGEYITNKITTSKNVDLLEYINTKRRKIKLEDLIDFYGGNSQVKKSITTVRTKFADGGTIPTLRNDINLSDRMLTAFEDYSNRPVQVAVVDIIDRTQAVNDVRVMAGLE